MDHVASSYVARSRAGVSARLGPYVLLGVLGRSPLSVVYDAFEPSAERRLALELVRVAGRGASATVDELHRSLSDRADKLRHLAHPNLVRTYAVEEFAGQIIVARQHIVGTTLARRREAGDLDGRETEETRQIIMQAAQGVAAAHRAGLIHGALSAENILIGNDGRVRVTGLVTAGLYHDPRFAPLAYACSVHTCTCSCTCSCSCSKRVADHCAPRAADDQRSLCAILRDTLRHHDSAGGRGLLSRFRTHSRSRVPSGLSEIVTRGLSSAPELRYPHVQALADALAEQPRSAALGATAWLCGLALCVAIPAWAAYTPSEATPARALTGTQLEHTSDEQHDQQAALRARQAPMHAKLGLLRAQAGHTNSALRHLEHAAQLADDSTRLDPWTTRAIERLADIRHEHGQLDAALEHAERAQRNVPTTLQGASPDAGRARARLVRIHLERGEGKEALEQLEAAQAQASLEHSKIPLILHIRAIEAHIELGMWDRAQRRVRQLGQPPNTPTKALSDRQCWALSFKAEIALRRGRPRDALRVLAKLSPSSIADCSPHPIDAAWVYALELRAAAHVADRTRVKTLLQTRTLLPEPANRKSALALAHARIEAYLSLGQAESALTAAANALVLTFDSLERRGSLAAESLELHARAALASGEMASAAQSLERAHTIREQISGARPQLLLQVHRLKAELTLKQGDWQSARAHLEQVAHLWRPDAQSRAELGQLYLDLAKVNWIAGRIGADHETGRWFKRAWLLHDDPRARSNLELSWWRWIDFQGEALVATAMTRSFGSAPYPFEPPPAPVEIPDMPRVLPSIETDDDFAFGDDTDSGDDIWQSADEY